MTRNLKHMKLGECWTPFKRNLARQLITFRHLCALILDSRHDNPFFRAPISDPQNILDIGTGKGTWAM